MGAELRNDRGTPPRLARVSTDVQRAVDAGEVRLSESSPSATRFRRAGRGSVEVITFKLLSKNPGALHLLTESAGARPAKAAAYHVYEKAKVQNVGVELEFGGWRDETDG